MADISWSPDNRTIYAVFAGDTPEQAQVCIEQLVEYMKKVLDNGNMFTMRVDTTAMHASPGFGSVKMLIQFMKAYRPKCAAQMKGTAIVIRSAVIRWLVNTMFSLHPPTSPVTLVESLGSADTYIHDAIQGTVRANTEFRYQKNREQESLLTAEDRDLCAQ